VSAVDARRLVLVVGPGRSGTSLLSGVLHGLGFHIPQPEVEADDTNPRGFGEPRWAVDFHTRLLKARGVTVNDSRPEAWEATFAAAGDPQVRSELRDWLAGELRQGDAVVVKDPRTAWFLPLWRDCAAELGVPTSYVTMLRHPTETLKSALKSYGTWQSPASRAAAWINLTLETERVTRGERRAFVRYEDLLGDWRREIGRIGQALDLPLITAGIADDRARAVDEFVDPGLHRNRVGWEELSVPARVEELAERCWEEIGPLAGPDPDAEPVLARLDATREAFRAMHAEAEAIAQSSVTAAKRAGRAQRPAGPPAAPPSVRVRVARRIPARYRRRIRRAVGSLRRRAA
jgi:hypothetical protein